MEVYEVYVAYFFSGIAAPAARNDVPFLYVILSMSSKQTCLQGFASDDIHKAQAFCKNAKNESFNAVALCALY